MFRVWCDGQVPVFLLPGFGLLGRAVFESEAVVSGLEDVAVVGQAVEQCGRHLGIAEDARPFAEAQVGGDDDAGALIELAQEMEEQRTAGCTERQIAELVEDHEIGMDEAVGDLSGSALRLLLLERIDQFDGGEEADASAVVPT